MSDLISRKALIADVKKYVSGTPLQEMFETIIDKQPTAYDVDKVVGQLEERKDDNLRYAKLAGNTDYKKIGHICRSDEDNYAIRIVKGGIEE